MKNKLFKKVLTAVLAAAMLMSSNGFTMNASAADKINVKQVLAKSYKETMAAGTTKQLQVFVEPENASNKKLSYSSSNRKVATVSPTGLVTAVSSGTSTITIRALDGSSKTDTVKITVLKDLTLTGKNVDKDNEIIVMDKTYGNVTVDSSVGDAVIYLSGVTVRNKLTLESGDYALNLYDSTANKVVIDEAKDEIVSLATTDEEAKAPKLNVGSNTVISELQAKVNAMIKQEDGSQIDGLRFEQNKEGKIVVYLENYSGKLLLNSSLGDMEVVATGCSIAEVLVAGDEKSGNVQLTNGGESAIENVALTGAAKLELAVPTTNISIGLDAKGASLTTKDSVGTIKNTGADTSIKVAGSVDNFVSDGAKAAIEVAKGGYVSTINIDGTGSYLTGSGEVSEAYVNADDCRIDIVNTLVVIGEKVSNTKVQGTVAKPGSSTTTTAPITGGAPNPPSIPSRTYRVGDIIYDNTFDDNKSDLVAFNGYGENPTVSIEAGGKDGTKGLKVTRRRANYESAGIDLYSLLGKHLTIKIEADIMSEANGTYQGTIKADSSYSQPAGMSVEGTAGNWYHLEGTYEISNDLESLNLYFETSGTPVYYIDNFKITITAVGEAIRVRGITLDKTTITVNKNASDSLQVTFDPANSDNRNVTWESEDITIASVDDRGIVTGVNDGTTRIVATAADGGFKAYCTVTVEGDAPVVTPAPDGSVIFDDMDVNTALKTIGWSSFSAKVILDPSNPSNRILEVSPENYNAAAVVQIKIPDGKTLGDFEKITYKAQWVSGDVGYKTIRAEAGTTLSGQFGNSDAGLIGSVARSAGATTSLAEETIMLNGTLSSLSGTIELAIGISCSGGVYYLDDIVLVPKPPVVPGEPQAITFDFEGSPVVTDSINAAVSTVTTDVMANEVSGDFTTPSPKMLKLVNSNYNAIPKFDISLPVGTSLSDYTKLTAKYYGVASTDSGWKPAYLYLGESLTYTGGDLGNVANPGYMAYVNNGFTGKGTWNTVTFDIDPALAAAVTGSAIQIAIGMSAPTDATYFLDNITLESVSGSVIVQDFEGTLTGVGSIGQTTVAATVATAGDFAATLLTNNSTNVLKVLPTDWDGAAVLDVSLATGTTISDYDTVTFKVYLPKITTPVNGYYYKKLRVKLGTEVNDMTGAIEIDTTDKQGSWQTFTYTITDDMKTSIGTATTFQLAIGCNTDEKLVAHYIDDITLNPAP